MVNLEDALDDCLQQMARGSLSLEECLARYPQHAVALEQLLQAAEQLETVSVPAPSPAFKARARGELLAHLHSHPRGSVPDAERMPTAAGRLSEVLQAAVSRVAGRPAYAVVLLTVVLLLGFTTAAQAALPGQPLYGWKRASERIWRTVHPDALQADLALSERRVSELIRVAGDPQRAPIAREAYGEALEQLATYDEPGTEARIASTLAEQQARLRAAGVEPPPLPEISPPISPTPTGEAQATPTPTVTLEADPTATPEPTRMEATLPPATLPQVTVAVPSPLPETLPATTVEATASAPSTIPTVEVTSAPPGTLSPSAVPTLPASAVPTLPASPLPTLVPSPLPTVAASPLPTLPASELP